MIVHRNHLPGLEERLADNVLGGAALMDRKQIFLPEYVLDSFLQADKALRSRVGVVGLEHGGHLVVAYCVGSDIGKHV